MIKFKKIKLNMLLTAPEEQLQSTILLQLTGRWQYDGIMWLALRSLKHSNNDFLDQIRYLSNSYPHEARWIPFLTYYTFKIVEVPEIEPAILWFGIRNPDNSAN